MPIKGFPQEEDPMTQDTFNAAGRSAEYKDGLTADELSSVGGGQASDGTSTDETNALISADKVQGTAVYNNAGDRIGTIDSVMLHKRRGTVAYAVMSFGGFLGIGERYHPLPWDVLSYDESKGGYNVQHSADDLVKAPNYSRDELDRAEYGKEVDTYYGSATRPGSTGVATEL